MKGKHLLGSVLAAALVLVLMAGISQAQNPESTPLGSAFTYQGRLQKNGSPINGACNLQFKLWDALSGGSQVGSTLTRAGVVISEGLFTVGDLDFGAQFTGYARWLEVAVKCSGDPSYTTLSPRQALTAAPAALSLVVPFSAQGASGGALVAVANSGTGTAGQFGSQLSSALHVTQAGGGDGLQVDAAAVHGVGVTSAGGSGFFVGSAGDNGLVVNQAAYDGVYVSSAGGDGVYVGSATNGLYVSSVGLDGVAVGTAGEDGMYVWQAANDGVRVDWAGAASQAIPSDLDNGFEVAGAAGNGLYVGRADFSGVHVNSARWDGLHVSSAGNSGVVVDSTGLDGVTVWWAGEDGVYADTSQDSGEWGFYTPDKIYHGSAQAGAGPSMLVAQNGDGAPLEPGDVVVISGLGAPFAGSDFPAPLVRRAGAGGAVAGVVYARFVAEEKAAEVGPDGQAQAQTSLHSRSTDGPVAPGEYLLLVVLGQAQVRASAAGGSIAAGDLLAAAADGQAALMAAGGYLPGSLVGTAMEPLDEALGSELIWVLVNPR